MLTSGAQRPPPFPDAASTQAAASGTEAEPQGQLQSLQLKLVKAEAERNIAQTQAAEVHQLRTEQARITSELEAAVAQHQREESVLAGQI